MKDKNKKCSEEQIKNNDTIINGDSDLNADADEDVKSCTCCSGECKPADNSDMVQENESIKIELQKLKDELDEKSRNCQEYLDKLQRVAAEFDNYKKRVLREKESHYSEVLTEVVAVFLPVVDNIERAVTFSDSDNETSLKEGIELILRQINESLKNLGVELIDCVGKKFDPQYQEAVMHVEDDSYDESIVVEEFKKGYKYQDKVIRYSMVKVAN